MEKLDGYGFSFCFSDKIPIGKFENNKEIAICSLYHLMYLCFNFFFQNFARKADGSGSLQDSRILFAHKTFTYWSTRLDWFQTFYRKLVESTQFQSLFQSGHLDRNWEVKLSVEQLYAQFRCHFLSKTMKKKPYS